MVTAWIDRYRARPLARRLALLIAACAGLTAALCMLALVATTWWQQQAHAREDADGMVRSLAHALQAPVAFDDRKGIAEALGILRARPEVSDAWVYDNDERLLGRYGHAEPPPGGQSGGLLDGAMVARATIEVDGVAVGRVIIVQQLAHLWSALAGALLAMGFGSLAAFAFSALLAQRLARGITQPVTTLAEASRSIAQNHDYSRRLPDAGGDEVGAAVLAFNQMLDEIRARGDALREANRDLERRVAERTLALRSEKERAEQASLAKTRFLANMSHELRTPLNAVIGAAQLLGDGRREGADRWHLVEAIRGSGINLLGLIENILDLSRIESGALELASEDHNLLECIEAAIATAAVAARLKGLETAYIVDPALEVWRHGDPQRLRQVLLNLLGNAVKFTQRGEVVLHVEAGDAPDRLRIRVSDTGIGIGAASQGRIFEPFRQADDGANRRYGGSGLGLAIASQLVQAMDGRIGVASELGRGTCFTLELPLPPARLPGREPLPLGHAVAYFEPHPASARGLAALLARLGCRAERCGTPDELRRWLDRQPAGGSHRLLVALDAAGSAPLLEAAAAWCGADRVVGMTRHDTPDTEATRARHGLGRTLIKPLLAAALVDRLDAAPCGEPTAGETMPADLANAAALARAPHVLVVEDDDVNQTIVCSMLHQAGYRTSAAYDGASALRAVAQQRFDLVLMDWQMPDMDGLEVTRRLRAGAAGRRGQHVPVVALTANAFAEDRSACLAAGMNDFLTKPVLAANLHATVARWVTAGHATDSRPTPLLG
jgi:signal transduction histidine kinase/ActR/RegA family two-component response regulator